MMLDRVPFVVSWCSQLRAERRVFHFHGIRGGPVDGEGLDMLTGAILPQKYSRSIPAAQLPAQHRKEDDVVVLWKDSYSALAESSY
jgi:hypothetical protein